MQVVMINISNKIPSNSCQGIIPKLKEYFVKRTFKEGVQHILSFLWGGDALKLYGVQRKLRFWLIIHDFLISCSVAQRDGVSRPGQIDTKNL